MFYVSRSEKMLPNSLREAQNTKSNCHKHGQVLAVILSVSSSKNNNLLFRYPCDTSDELQDAAADSDSTARNEFAVKNDDSYYEVTNQFFQHLGIGENGLITYSDNVLSTFLAVQSSQLANKPFDVKVDDVQFVGYPVSVKHRKKQSKETSSASLTNVNVVFALPESVTEATKACYHQLSQQVAMAIKHEESRCCYFCTQKKLMEPILEDYREGGLY
ncbi:NPRL3 [Bugula neritina]|uniref:NPRL3 n=1 Tax=Bugula neritina TaxID=10212 RepID=A0A7J7JY63_BUGNE|nr:NPRL3 [Bugula neritina]